MKKGIITLIALIMFGAFSAQAQKFGHFDYVAVMDTLDTYKRALAKSEELTADFEAQMKEIEKEYTTKLTDLESNPDMPDIIRQTRQRELQQLGQVAQELERQYQMNAQKIQERYMVPMDEWLEEAVDIVGKKKGLDYLFYYQEGNTNFWYNEDRAVDVTNAIITELLRLERENPVKEPGQ
jgi:outer membrane protein